MEKINVHWRTRVGDQVANAFGYNTHNKFMIKYSSPFLNFDNSADIAIDIRPADQFVPVEGKFNILFSMWEWIDVPQAYIDGLNKADLIIVPSRFCKDIFSKVTDKPIEVCWEGVESSSYPFHQRSMPMFNMGEKFRFLWVGAPNPRKGYPIILEMVKAIEKMPMAEMYIKTTAPHIDWEKVEEKIKDDPTLLENERFREAYENRKNDKKQISETKEVHGKHGNIIFDARKLSFADLISLYNSAHSFVLPTFGEGWGLTLCEAMATGSPCIATPVTGCKDFFDDQVGFPIDYDIKSSHLRGYEGDFEGYIPDTQSCFNQMMAVMNNYEYALKIGKKASNRIHSKFTWKKSGQRLAEIIRRYSHACVT